MHFQDRINRETSPARQKRISDDASERAHDGPRTPTVRTIRSVLGLVRRKRSTQSIQSSNDSAVVYVPPATPPSIISFADTINNRKLSDYLLWYLYFDIVKPLERLSNWYYYIEPADMFGWIALGQFLSTGISYGLDLVSLDSTIGRLHLDRQTVREILIKSSDPDAMAWTTLAATLKAAEEEHLSELETLGLVRCQLTKLLDIATCLQPTESSLMAVWRTEVISRIGGFLDYLIIPRMNALQGMELPLESENNDTSRKLGLYFHVLQRRRPVPLCPYETYPDFFDDGLSTRVPSPEGEHPPNTLYQEELAEREWERVLSESEKRRLGEENRLLRSRVRNLNDEIRRTKQDKERLIDKIIQVGHDRIAEIPEPSIKVIKLPSRTVTEATPKILTRRNHPIRRTQPTGEAVHKYNPRHEKPSIPIGLVTPTSRTSGRPTQSKNLSRRGNIATPQYTPAPDGSHSKPLPALPCSLPGSPRSVDT